MGNHGIVAASSHSPPFHSPTALWHFTDPCPMTSVNGESTYSIKASGLQPIIWFRFDDLDRRVQVVLLIGLADSTKSSVVFAVPPFQDSV